ncbi:hypothetical protein RRG08_066354 [Elysia crispata]|uniref:Uncharacterized protein n=1 Tax=Elysia crispata TaxID=231223 RepID=A0AAE1CVE9_9GAST|nr:hypothetical protein RRG08_066354 [Elysia crispata]
MDELQRQNEQASHHKRKRTIPGNASSTLFADDAMYTWMTHARAQSLIKRQLQTQHGRTLERYISEVNPLCVLESVPASDRSIQQPTPLKAGLNCWIIIAVV